MMPTKSLVSDRLAGATPSESRGLSVGFVVPGWPPDSFANGIVTSVGAVVGGVRRAGHRALILAQQVDGRAGESVRHLGEMNSGRSPLRWLSNSLAYRINPDRATMARQGRLIREAVEDPSTLRPVELIEMEESFGWSRGVQRELSIPVVVRLHGPWFLTGAANGSSEDIRSRRRIEAEGRAIAEAFAVTSPSRDVLDRTRAYYGLRLDEAEVIPNPVAPCAIEHRWPSDDVDPNLILFIGRFDRLKGGDVLISAFDRVLPRVPGARLVFVGPDRGMVDDQGRNWSFADYVRQQAPMGDAAGRIEFLGQQPHGSLAALRRKAAVVVVCSRYETFSMTVLEAWAHGCPVVASNIGGIAELVQDGVNGLLCNPGDPRDLAEALIRILGDRSLAERLGRQAAIDCERKYHPDVVAGQLADYYRRVLERWEARRGRMRR
jgi:glycosyltransferase involved in cell wall biosynthesis